MNKNEIIFDSCCCCKLYQVIVRGRETDIFFYETLDKALEKLNEVKESKNYVTIYLFGARKLKEEINIFVE